MIIEPESIFAVSLLHPYGKYNVLFFDEDFNSDLYKFNMDGLEAQEFIEDELLKKCHDNVIVTCNTDNKFECVLPQLEIGQHVGMCIVPS